MSLANGYPLLLGDPGGPGGRGGGPSNYINGDYTGARLPHYMDNDGTAGQLQYLKMQAVSGQIPQDPFLLRLSVEKCIGGQIDGAYKEQQGLSYVLKVRSQTQFNRLLKMNKLNDGTAISITEHPQLNQTKCVVSNADCTKLDDEYLKQQLAAQGVKDIRRIKRRKPDGTSENTPTIVLTLSGTVIPPHIDFGWTRCKTRNFYPTPMLCYRCWEYGHTGKRCTHPTRVCGRCSKVHEEENQKLNEQSNIRSMEQDESLSTPTSSMSERIPCTEAAYCKLCKTSDHSVSSRKCPVYLKEVAIQHIRVDRGISYSQATREYEARMGASRSNSTYTGVVNASKDSEIEDLKAVVEQLRTDAKAKDARIAEMELSPQNRGVHDRMQAIREHGTIEDLIRQVSELTSTIEKLQQDLRKKDQFILDLMARQTPEAESCVEIICETPEQQRNALSDSSAEIPPTASFTDPIANKKVAKWVNAIGTHKDTGTNPKKIAKDTKNKKKLNNDGNSTDGSMESIISGHSVCTMDSSSTHPSNSGKRNHEESEASNNSSTSSPNAKRHSKVRKAKATNKN